jgi:hypothetical protein
MWGNTKSKYCEPTTNSAKHKKFNHCVESFSAVCRFGVCLVAIIDLSAWMDRERKGNMKNYPVTCKEKLYPEDFRIIFLTGIKSIIIDANNNFIASSGPSKERLVGCNHNIVRHPDIPPVAFQNLWIDEVAHRLGRTGNLVVIHRLELLASNSRMIVKQFS